MQNIDTLANTDYNVINGQVRSAIDVPLHDKYNPSGITNRSTVG